MIIIKSDGYQPFKVAHYRRKLWLILFWIPIDRTNKPLKSKQKQRKGDFKVQDKTRPVFSKADSEDGNINPGENLIPNHLITRRLTFLQKQNIVY